MMGSALRNPSYVAKRKIKVGSSFRWNDGEVGCREGSARAPRAWVPACAGMTFLSDNDFVGAPVLLPQPLS